MKIRKDRRGKNRHRKDQADIAFVIWSFHNNWGEWRERRMEMGGIDEIWSKWIDRALLDFNQLYISVDVALFEVLEHFEAMDIKISVDEIRFVVKYFLEAIGL
jgi:hypothetical protein